MAKTRWFCSDPTLGSKNEIEKCPVTDLCGIAEGIGNFFANYGVYTCGDMQHLPISVLAKRIGNLGRRIWYMCQGADPESVHTKLAETTLITWGRRTDEMGNLPLGGWASLEAIQQGKWDYYLPRP